MGEEKRKLKSDISQVVYSNGMKNKEIENMKSEKTRVDKELEDYKEKLDSVKNLNE